MRGVGPKATDSLLSLEADQIDMVLSHHDQKAVCGRIGELTAWLREANTPDDFYELQRDILELLIAVEQRRADCVRAVSRLGSGKKITDMEPLPEGREQMSGEDWNLEAYVYARLARQIRTVGDGLAWRAFGYDRRVVVALSRNQSPGPMHGKSGLPHELAHVQGFRDETGQFALLHDITNCLRIADVTEFRDDGARMLVEVKASGRKRSEQTRRAQQAVDALNRGGHLPGELRDARLVTVKTRYRTSLSQLTDLMSIVAKHGCRGMRLSQGRALMGLDMPALVSRFDSGDPAGGQLWDEERAAVIRRAQIEGATQLVRGASFDTASRSPVQVPFAIFPLPPSTVSRLICDYVGFETILSVDDLADAFRANDLEVTISLPNANTHLVGDQSVLRVSTKRHSLTMHQQSLTQLLHELVEPRPWVSALAELMYDFAGGGTRHPMVVFAGEARSWR